MPATKTEKTDPKLCYIRIEIPEDEYSVIRSKAGAQNLSLKQFVTDHVRGLAVQS